MKKIFSLVASLMLLCALGCGENYTVEELTEDQPTMPGSELEAPTDETATASSEDVREAAPVGKDAETVPMPQASDADAAPDELAALDQSAAPSEGGGVAAEGGTAEGREIGLGPKLAMTAPETWQRREPRMGMIEAEFAIPAAEGDKADGRMTVMTAGGSVEDNVARWKGQFIGAEGGQPEAKIEKVKAAGIEATVVDLAGTFKDQPGPFAPAVERPGYRMLGAIIPTAQGNYFVKFYGPEKTVSASAEGFRKMIAGIKKR